MRQEEEPITAAQVALIQRGAEILSARPPLADEAAATRSGSFGLVGGSSVRRVELTEGMSMQSPAHRERWAARHMLVVTASSLALLLLIGCVMLADVASPAQVEGFLSGGASREDALLSGASLKKTAAAARLAKLAQTWPSDNVPPIPGNARAAKVEESASKQSNVMPELAAKPVLKVVEAKPLQSLAKTTAVATAKVVVPKPAVKVVKSQPPTPKAKAVEKSPAVTAKPTVLKPAEVKPKAAPAKQPVSQAAVPQEQQYVQEPQEQPYQQPQYAYGQQPPRYQAPPQYMQPQGYAPPQDTRYQAPPQYMQPQGYAPQNTLYQAPQPVYYGYPPQQQGPPQYAYSYNGYEQPAQYAMPQTQPPPQQLMQPQSLPQQLMQPQSLPQQTVQAQQHPPHAQQSGAAPAAPKQALSVKPASMPKVETTKQLQEQVQQEALPQMQAQLPQQPPQKQSLQQRLVASLPPSVQQQAQVVQQTGPAPMLVDGSAADTASLQQQAGQQVVVCVNVNVSSRFFPCRHRPQQVADGLLGKWLV